MKMKCKKDLKKVEKLTLNNIKKNNKNLKSK